MLPCRIKLLCSQFGLLPRLMWPLTIYEVLSLKVEKLKSSVNTFAKKWLGLPRCLSNIRMYKRGILELPILSFAEKYKCLEMTQGQKWHMESHDSCSSPAASILVTRRKWVPSSVTQQAKSDPGQWDIIGLIQQCRKGLVLGQRRPTWHRATPAQRKMVHPRRCKTSQNPNNSGVKGACDWKLMADLK